MTQLVLADDHVVFTEALTTVLTERSLGVRATARTLDQAIRLVSEHRPDLCLLDRHFVDGDGLDAVATLIRVSPRTRVLVLTSDPDPAAADLALRSGAAGYMHKTRGVRVLLDGIARLLRGQVVVERARPAPAVQAGDPHLAAHLTARERACLLLLAEGLGTVAIARRLGISHTTVRSHVQAVLTKLGVHSRLEAVAFALRHGLVARAAATDAPAS